MTVRAIDPPGCGCTGCLQEETGDSVPLERATDAQIAALLQGRLLNHSGAEFTITVTAHADGHTWNLTDLIDPI